jgi:methylmalonyl-CoA mutase
MSEFPKVNYSDWRKLVDGELKGAAFDEKMLTRTSEGIVLQPLYKREDIRDLPAPRSLPGLAPFVRGATAAGYTGQPWEVSQEIKASSPAEFNHAARNSLASGLNALNMVLDKATRDGADPDWAKVGEVGLGGLSVATLRDLERALDGIDLRKTSLFVRSGASGMPFAALMVALMRRRHQPATRLRGCIEMDPLGVLAHEGTLAQSLEGAYREMAILTKWASKHATGLQTICVHSRAWHESGGNAVQELAFTLATAVEYLREMNNRELDVDTVAPRVRFAVTVGSNLFLEISKLRALRMLWARAVAALEGSQQSQRLSLHVRTSLWNKTVRDPYNNIVRATVEAFAGVLGGCDSLQVGAFDEVVRTPDDFSRRLARNTQLVLQKECHLTHVVDPAGGSWFVESLTSDLATRAWALFQEVERLGGMAAALRVEFPQKAVAATAAQKIQAVADKKQIIVGVNHYINAKETPLPVPASEPAAFHKRRAQQIASHRTSLEDADNEVVLKKLGGIVNVRGDRLFTECVEAAVAGATLGEIVRAIRINDRPCAPVTPVTLTRAAAALEGK